MRGFKTLKTGYATMKGFEVMRALRKGQAGLFAFQDGIVGEARLVERAFGHGNRPEIVPTCTQSPRIFRMADQQHIHWLFEGCEEWNKRRRNSEFTPDFSSVDLYQVFRDANGLNSDGDIPLTGFDLRRANFADSRLNTPLTTASADLRHANLRSADFRTAYLPNAKLDDADLGNAGLGDADLAQASLCRSVLTSARLSGTKLFGADLTDANLRSAYLEGANLCFATLDDADLTSAVLMGGRSILLAAMDRQALSSA